jgi:hypothetical protein
MAIRPCNPNYNMKGNIMEAKDLADVITAVRHATQNMSHAVYIGCHVQQHYHTGDTTVNWTVHCYDPMRVEAKAATLEDATRKFIAMYRAASDTPETVVVRAALPAPVASDADDFAEFVDTPSGVQSEKGYGTFEVEL